MSKQTQTEKRKRSTDSCVGEQNSRRRLTSASSLPDISRNYTDSDMSSFRSSVGEDTPPSSSPVHAKSNASDPDSVCVVGTKGDIKVSVINELIIKAINTQAFMNAFAPMIASAITPHIQLIVHNCVQPLMETIKDQKNAIKELKESNSKLIERVSDLEFGLEDLEQYGRRTSLRFHNVPSENCTDDTDSVVVKICQEMGVNINTDDINRSHPIGRPRNNKRQIICRFRNWKIKNKVYSAKNS